MEDKENILDFIFEARSEKLAIINKEDREFLNSPKANIDNAYLEFTNILGKIPTETRKEILEKFIIILICLIIFMDIFVKSIIKTDLGSA